MPDRTRSRVAGIHVAWLSRLFSLRIGSFKHVSRKENLTTHFDYSGLRAPVPGALAQLKDLPRLEELNLSGWRPAPEGKGLGELKQLKRLTLVRSETLTDADLAPLSGLESLESLHLSDLRKVANSSTSPSLKSMACLCRFIMKMVCSCVA